MTPVETHRPSPSAGSHRRPDIEGLRAVAVLLVVAYHCDLGLSGGYLGVDLFFVVSGFVITQVLVREMERTGTIRLRAFYARRVRRLLPALAVMMTVVLVLVAIATNPADAQPFVVRTAVASQAFVTNLFLYRHVGYFDATAAQNPFLHLWSLSVEEQFYLAFPILFLLAHRGRATRRRMTAVLGAVLVASLAISVALSTEVVSLGLAVPARFAYFATPTRAWELLAGALLAIWWPQVRTAIAPWSTAIGAAGVGLLVVALVIARDLGDSPSGVPILPAAAAVMVLGSGAGSGIVTRTLSLRPLVVLGGWSYAWYLWHWPLIVLAQTLWPGRAWLAPLAAIVALVPAALSSVFVERPFRIGALDRTRAIRLLAIGAVVPVLAAAIVWRGADDHWGLDVPTDWFDFPMAARSGCTLFNRDIANTWPEASCRTGADEAPTVLVLGDLHADSVSTGVEVAATELGLGTAVWDRDDCPFTGRTPVDYPRCRDWVRAALRLVDRLRPVVVVVANDGPSYVSGDVATPIADATGARPTDRAAALDAWRTGFEVILDELERRQVAVVAVAAIPDYGAAFPRATLSVVRPGIVVPSMTRSAAAEQRRDVIEIERAAIERHDRMTMIDPLDALCDQTCRPEHDGVWWYYDQRHLTRSGGRLLAPSIAAAIELVAPEGA